MRSLLLTLPSACYSETALKTYVRGALLYAHLYRSPEYYTKTYIRPASRVIPVDYRTVRVSGPVFLTDNKS